jgi:hypothetical protein
MRVPPHSVQKFLYRMGGHFHPKILLYNIIIYILDLHKLNSQRNSLEIFQAI